MFSVKNENTIGSYKIPLLFLFVQQIPDISLSDSMEQQQLENRTESHGNSKMLGKTLETMNGLD